MGGSSPAKRPRPKVLVSERCVDSWKSDWQLWLDRQQIGRTTRLIGNSQSVADFYRELGVPSDKLVVIPNARRDCPPALRAEPRPHLGRVRHSAGSRVVGFAGRLAPQKRVHRHRLGHAIAQAIDRPGVLDAHWRRTRTDQSASNWPATWAATTLCGSSAPAKTRPG